MSSTHVSRITSHCTTPNANARSTVDDGTSTIECAFRPDEGKLESKPSEKQGVRPLGQNRFAVTQPLPPPLVPVGSMVKVQGKVRAKHNAREIHGETIGLWSTMVPLERIYLRELDVERCRGPGEELEHWRRITSLHKDYYFLPEKFVIPSSSGTAASGEKDMPRTPKSARVMISTPSTCSTAFSSSTSSPTKSSDDPSVRFYPCSAESANRRRFHASFLRDFAIHLVSAVVI